jgi:hypothetical protein
MMTEKELQSMAFQLAAMRNQVDAMMTVVEAALEAPQTQPTKQSESGELEDKVRTYFGGQKESPDKPSE